MSTGSQDQAAAVVAEDIPDEPDLPVDVALPAHISEHFENIVVAKCVELMTLTLYRCNNKVVAGLVMTEGWDLATCRVVAVATGCRGTTSSYLSVDGTCVIDSHAEVIVRRCFKRFLYAELTKHTNATFESSILVLSEGNTRFELKPGVMFHLYISDAPCGDGRMRSITSRGYLRAKVDGYQVQCTRSVRDFNSIQSWFDIVNDAPLVTMSCSDKLARWNIIGLQGALLSRYIAPIMLKSITLGSQSNMSVQLYRAVAGRLHYCMTEMSPPINHVMVGDSGYKQHDRQMYYPLESYNWTEGDMAVEGINSVIGKTMPGYGTSRLAKKSFFEQFLALARQLPCTGIADTANYTFTYIEHKYQALEYQELKLLFIQKVKEADMGEWVRKPMVFEQFTLPVANTSREERDVEESA